MSCLRFLLACLLLWGSPATAQIFSNMLIGTGSTVGSGPPPAGDPTVQLLPAPRSAWKNWQMAGLQSVGGIPNRTTISSTVNPSGGDDTANIQNAINNCGTNQVVQLGSGTFELSSNTAINLNKPCVVRGMGPGITTVDCNVNCAVPGSLTSATHPIFMMGGGVNFGSPIPLTSDAATDANGHFVPGTYTVNVANTTGISVGSLVNVDELGDGQPMPDCCFNGGTGLVWASPEYRYEWNAHSPTVAGNFDSACYDNSFQSNGNCTNTITGSNHTDASAYSVRAGGVMEEYHLVTAINGNTLTFDSPLTINYRVANSAAVTAFVTANEVQYVGLENLTLTRGGNGGVILQGCIYCWVKNVENYHYFNPGIYFSWGTFRSQLTGSWLHNGAWPVNGGGGYSIGLTRGASEILIDNNISMMANKVIVIQASGAGSVVAYNYMDDSYISGSAGWVETGLNNSHLIGSHHTLFEGNVSDNIDADFTHGATSYLTAFDNWITGIRATFTGEYDGTVRNDSTGCCSPRRALASHPYTYRQSFIDNIAGLSTVTTTGNGWVYSDNGGGGGNSGSSSMLKLGWNDVNSAGTNKDDVANVIYPNDPRTMCPGSPTCTGTWVTANGCMSDSTNPCTTVVTGNYDYVQNQVTWDSRGIKSIPPSFYLATTPPSFWDSGAFPPFVPGVPPTINDIPAHRRYLACASSGTSANPGSASCLYPSGPPVISGVSLSGGGNFVTPATSSTPVGTLTALCSTGSCTPATFALSTSGACSSAANNNSFAISGSNLNIGGSTVNAGTYTVGIQVSLTGATNTPQCYVQTLTGAALASYFNTVANGTLSNSNRTVTASNLTAGNDIQDDDHFTMSSISSQKVYYEMTCTAVTNFPGAGWSKQYITGQQQWLGKDGNSAGFVSNKNYQHDGTYPANSWDGCVTGDVVGLYLDGTVSPPQLYASTLHGGAWAHWNNATRSGSTAPTSGGYSPSANMNTGTTWIPTATVSQTGDSMTICGNSTCAASPSGIPTGASWFDTLAH